MLERNARRSYIATEVASYQNLKMVQAISMVLIIH